MSSTPPMDVVDRGRATVVEVPNELCDTCGHHAYVHAMMRNGPVSYCAHHGTEYWDTLTRDAITLVDLRHVLHETR